MTPRRLVGDGVGVQTDLAAWLLAQVQADLDALDQMTEYDCDAGGHWMYDRIRVECDTKRRIIEMFPTSAPKMEYGGFAGFEARDCGEHRTVGPHRAWCHDCNEWCYPDAPCVRCHGVSPVLRLLAAVYKHRDGYRAEWAPDGR
jgi:hypothetical protein